MLDILLLVAAPKVRCRRVHLLVSVLSSTGPQRVMMMVADTDACTPAICRSFMAFGQGIGQQLDYSAA